ncbi:MAG TPA: TonB-dependent receptor [Sphingomicrobium sp.]|nr:TonB-dependent receptor [Sphingomicrobium sp.]
MLHVRSRLLATTLLVGTGLLAAPATAQTAPPPASPADTANGAQPETTAPVEATTPPSTNAQGAPVSSGGDIVITGSRIPQPNLTSASPVTVLSSQDIKLQGTTRTEDLINSLPQSFASQGSNISNGALGIATVNLRGLGVTRTLVLINGRRLQPGDPRAPVSDINFIPSALVKRVDVLTGGASSVYGADAVAGVVNFIMDTSFRGLRIDAQASTFMHYNDASDRIIGGNFAANRNFRPPHGQSVNGGAQDLAAAFGAGFDDNRGSIMAYATYRKQDPVLQASRDYSFCSLAARTAAQGGAGSGTRGSDFNCGGSATSAFGTFFTNVGTFHVGGANGNDFVPGSIPFNFGPYNFYQRPDERYTLGAFAEYEISPGAKPYLEAMFMNDTSHSKIAPSGDFFNTTTINCDNPLLSPQQFNTICVPNNTFVDAQGVTRAISYTGRRNVEGGGREDHLERSSWRVVGGIRGDLLKGLSYDAYYQYGTTRFSQAFLNDFSIRRLNMALDVIANPAVGGVPGVAAGTPVCRAALPGSGPGGGALDATCVPYNIFTLGGVTPEALAYLQTPLISRGNVNETIANANITVDGGEYGVQTPWSDRGIGLNFGGEYRKEALDFLPDIQFQSGDGAGQGGAVVPVNGHFDVREAFAELQIPIVSHSFFEELTVGAGYRYSDYKVAGNHFNTDTYKLSVEFAPIHDVRARASYNRAVRAPNVVELFAPQAVGLGGTVDPCAGAAPTATAAQCLNTGVGAGFGTYGSIAANPANQYNALIGGNPDLAPEKADTYTVGLVLQPRFLPGLAFTLDYFDIKVEGLISTLGFQTIMSQCLASGDPFFCSKIHRTAGNGSLWLSPAGFIETTNTNIGGLRTKGFDLNGSYSRRLGGLGTVNVSYVGTMLRKLVIDTGVSGSGTGQDGKFDCAGLYGSTCGSFLSGAPNPKYRHKLRLGLTMKNGLGISGQWRYFSSVKNDGLEADCDISATATCTGNVADANRHIKAQSFFDLAMTARLADRYNFRLGVNNLLDKEPPIVGGEVANAPFGNGNTFPQVYDALGRFLFAGVTVDF